MPLKKRPRSDSSDSSYSSSSSSSASSSDSSDSSASSASSSVSEKRQKRAKAASGSNSKAARAAPAAKRGKHAADGDDGDTKAAKPAAGGKARAKPAGAGAGAGADGAGKPKAKRAAKPKVVKVDEAELTSKVDLNPKITDMLAQLAAKDKADGKVWEARAYYRAINSVKKYTKVIKDGAEALTLPGVGEAMSKKIDELLTTGTIRQLADLKGPHQPPADPAAVAKATQAAKEAAAARALASSSSSSSSAAAASAAAEDPAKVSSARAFAALEAAAAALDPKLKLDRSGAFRRKADGPLAAVVKHADLDVDTFLALRASSAGSEGAHLRALVDALVAQGRLASPVFESPCRCSATLTAYPPGSAPAAAPSRSGSQREAEMADAAAALEERRRAEEAEKAKKVQTLHFSIPDEEDEDDDAGAGGGALRGLPLAKPAAAAPPKAAAPAAAAPVPPAAKSASDQAYGEQDLVLHLAPFEAVAVATLLLTGPAPFVDRVRTQAQSRGLKLTELGLERADGSLVTSFTEADLLERVGMDFVPPEKRA